MGADPPGNPAGDRMQIIGGRASGIRIAVPRGDEVRPTSAAARKALFDSIADFADIAVADIFAGSGALGLEAASRGAKEIVFIEKSPGNCDIIEENARKILRAGASFGHRIIRADIFRLFRRRQDIVQPDIVFADPPYAKSADYFSEIVQNANFAEWAARSVLVWEKPDFRTDFPSTLQESHWRLENARIFGGREFLFLRKK